MSLQGPESLSQWQGQGVRGTQPWPFAAKDTLIQVPPFYLSINAQVFWETPGPKFWGCEEWQLTPATGHQLSIHPDILMYLFVCFFFLILSRKKLMYLHFFFLCV